MSFERKYANLTYAAEDEVWLSPKAKKWREPVNVADMRERFLDRGAWRASGLQIERSQSDSTRGTYFPRPRLITLGKRAGLWVMVHELAHHMDWIMHQGVGHGPSFRHCYVALVRLEIGDYWAKRLEKAFERRGLS